MRALASSLRPMPSSILTMATLSSAGTSRHLAIAWNAARAESRSPADDATSAARTMADVRSWSLLIMRDSVDRAPWRFPEAACMRASLSAIPISSGSRESALE